MASTYVNDLRLNEMATGDASGSWGTVTNTNLELIGEAFSYGTETIGDADSTLTIADGAADAARSFYLKITSSVDLTTTRIVTLGPNTVSKVWMIENATTGSQVITIKQGSGATINVPNGQVKMISTDGAGSGGAVLDLLVDVSGTALVTGVLTTTAATVFNGGFASNADSTLGTDKKVQFRDAAIYINSSVDGQLDIVADTEIQIAATTVDLNGALDVSGTLGVTGVLTATSLDISGDIDVDGTTNLDVVDIDGATQIDATVTVGVDDTGYDVKFFGATTGKSLLWDESADSLIVTGTTTLVGTTNLDVVDIDGATQIDATVTVGVDDTGYDVKFFGATAGAYMLWDESADDLILGGAAGLSVNSTALVTGVLTTTAATVSNGGGQFNGAINVGVDDTGYDVKFFGATTGKSLLWDESADSLTVAGNLTVDGGTIKLDGNYPVGTGNVALGNTALDSNVSGEYNTAIGDVSLTSNTTGISNVSVGAFSMENNIDGNYNTSVGVLGLRLNESGLYNTAIGYAALLNNTSSSNTAVGYQALLDNLGGFSLVGVGATALQNNTTGYDNVAVGVNSLNLNTSGINNTAMGSYALSSTITTSNSTAVGYRSLLNATGTNSNAFGYEAGLNVSTAQYGTYIGSRSASAGAAVITGDANTMIGEGAGYVLQGGANSNTFLGQGSGSYVTTGSANTILGRYNGNQGGLDLRTSSNNIVLSDGDGNVRLHIDGGNGSITTPSFFAGGTGYTGDLDDLKKSGLYRSEETTTNNPTANYYTVIVYGNGSNLVSQIATVIAGVTTYVRSFNTSWTAWQRLDT
jgi:hypothetical protein